MSIGVDSVTRVSLRSNPDYLPRVRRIIACLGDGVGMDQQEIDEAKLVLTEACANAITHGSPQGERDCVHITFRSVDGAVMADVTDFGGPTDPPDQTGPASQGFGMRLMRMLADSVQFIKHRAGLTVRFTKCAKHARRIEAATLEFTQRN
ncbi:MAG: ATP-binding protein [Armatimonadetes bacterium]|nr:ATP-binding protein [Armatimonadota bacterium]